MPNYKSNLIPVPTRPARNLPKPLAESRIKCKTCSSQTERVALIKEENLAFCSNKSGQNDGGMRRDYVKAVNYINSCHKFINTVIEKNAPDKNNVFHLPMVTNFTPIFQQLVGKTHTKLTKRSVNANVEMKKNVSAKTEEMKQEFGDTKKVQQAGKSKSEDRKSRSSFGTRKRLEKVDQDPVSVGDCAKNIQLQEADLPPDWKQRIKDFWAYLEERMKKVDDNATHKYPPFKNLDDFKQALSKLYKMSQFKPSEIKTEKANVPEPPPFIEYQESVDDCSVIVSDTDYEEAKDDFDTENAKFTCYKRSTASLVSDTSEIKSDSDFDTRGFKK